jgi:RimJ/RimL family protein N-acetyltransferase
LASAPADDLRLLEINLATTFALSPSGRIERESAPDNSEGPRLSFAGCAGGNIIRFRHDVSEEIAASVLSLAENEPHWSDPTTTPGCLEALVAQLSREAPAEAASPAAIYHLPNGLTYDAGAAIVRWDAAEGRRLAARLAEEEMPPHLVEAGFVGLDDLWEPWCAAMDGDQIAAMAFAARIGGPDMEVGGMEVGVYTFPAFRGRGLAAAVTAAWSSLPGLADRILFYSTLTTNRSSQRVAERLGLRRFGVSVRIG